MNLFEVLIFDFILMLFPLLIYIIFLSTNKNISKNNKNLFWNFTILTSFFITYKYNTDHSIISFLLLNSLIVLAYIKNQYIVANVMVVLILYLYSNMFNNIYIMIIPYIILLIVYVLKRKIKINNFIFSDIFIFSEYICLLIWIKLFNINIINNVSIIELIFIMIFSYLVIHIIYVLYNQGEEIVNYHIDYSDLKKDKQLRLSLFKITHEIKNPIAVIKAYLDMLNPNNEKQVNKYIPIIKNEIDRLLALLQDFLLVNRENIDFDIMDINMLLENVISSLKPLLDENKINLKEELIDDEIFIDGDYKRLSQVIINIIKNSVEAMDKKRGNIKIKNIINENKLNIIIEDNGSGISSDNLEKIKEPFYTTKERGTGLGVSLSNEIIEAHNGLLIYDSKEGKGTKVTIQLPLNRKERFI